MNKIYFDLQRFEDKVINSNNVFVFIIIMLFKVFDFYEKEIEI